MKLPMRKWLKRAYLAVGVSGALLVGVAFLLYKIAFPSWSLSPNGNDWIVFGTYIGGVLGPGFSALAFVALLLTLKVSQDSLDSAVNQQRVGELERALSGKMKEIEEQAPAFNAAHSQAMGNKLRKAADASVYAANDPHLLRMANLIRDAAFFARELLVFDPPSVWVTYFKQKNCSIVQQLYGLRAIDKPTAEVFIIVQQQEKESPKVPGNAIR